MWETLCNVEGDCYFVDANFRTLPASQPVASSAGSNTTAGGVAPTAGISQEDQE